MTEQADTALATLAGRRALVTGASRGLGVAIARQLHSLGAEVWLTDLHLDDAQAAAEGIGCRALALDVTDAFAIAAAFDTASRDGQVDLLVNNAGVSLKSGFVDTTAAQMDLLYQVNVRGTFLVMQEFARRFVQSDVRGKIINVTSTAAKRSSAGFAMYAASKAAAGSLVQSGGRALAAQGINVNGVAPGVIDTPLWQTMGRSASGDVSDSTDQMDRHRYGSMIPLGYVASPDDVASVVSFLASPASDYMTGEVVTVDGGMSA